MGVGWDLWPVGWGQILRKVVWFIFDKWWLFDMILWQPPPVLSPTTSKKINHLPKRYQNEIVRGQIVRKVTWFIFDKWLLFDVILWQPPPVLSPITSKKSITCQKDIKTTLLQFWPLEFPPYANATSMTSTLVNLLWIYSSILSLYFKCNPTVLRGIFIGAYVECEKCILNSYQKICKMSKYEKLSNCITISLTIRVNRRLGNNTFQFVIFWNHTSFLVRRVSVNLL